MSSDVLRHDRRPATRSPSEWMVLRQLRDTVMHSWGSPRVEDAIELAERGGDPARILLSTDSVQNARTSTITIPHTPSERESAVQVSPDEVETEIRRAERQASRLHLPTLTSAIQIAVLLFTLYLLTQAVKQRTTQTSNNPSLTLSVVFAAATGDNSGG